MASGIAIARPHGHPSRRGVETDVALMIQSRDSAFTILDMAYARDGVSAEVCVTGRTIPPQSVSCVLVWCV